MTGSPMSIECAGCGQALRLTDVVVVSREIAPMWASPAESVATISHQTCEPVEGRADHDWARESPQTLLQMLVKLAGAGDAVHGRGPGWTGTSG
jgi:hypothetical protein